MPRGSKGEVSRNARYDPNQGNFSGTTGIYAADKVARIIYVVGKFVGVALFKSKRVRLALSCPWRAITLNSI